MAHASSAKQSGEGIGPSNDEESRVPGVGAGKGLTLSGDSDETEEIVLMGLTRCLCRAITTPSDAK